MGMFDKMKEAKNMYSNIKKAQNEINKIKVEGTAGAGAVSVTVKGNHRHSLQNRRSGEFL